MSLPPLAFFDVDHTLTRGSTGLHFAREAVRRGVIGPWRLLAIPFLYFRYRLGPRQAESPGPVYDRFPGFAGLDQARVLETAEAAIRTRILPDIRDEAHELVAKARSEGSTVILATSTFDFLAKPLAQAMGIEEVIASPVEFVSGKTSGRVPGGLVLAHRKLELCRLAAESRGLSLSDCSFYSDSVHDLPLLLAVGRPIAVNPDLRLRRHALARSWPILAW